MRIHTNREDPDTASASGGPLHDVPQATVDCACSWKVAEPLGSRCIPDCVNKDICGHRPQLFWWSWKIEQLDPLSSRPPDKHGEFIHLRACIVNKSLSMVLFLSVYRVDPQKTVTLRSQHANTGRLAPLGFTGVSIRTDSALL